MEDASDTDRLAVTLLLLTGHQHLQSHTSNMTTVRRAIK
jgi:hypothetical protein